MHAPRAYLTSNIAFVSIRIPDVLLKVRVSVEEISHSPAGRTPCSNNVDRTELQKAQLSHILAYSEVAQAQHHSRHGIFILIGHREVRP